MHCVRNQHDADMNNATRTSFLYGAANAGSEPLGRPFDPSTAAISAGDLLSQLECLEDGLLASAM